MNKGLICDLDGTLTEHTNSWDVIREKFGLGKGAYARTVLSGLMSEDEFRKMEIKRWRKAGVTKEKIEKIFENLPVRKGAAELLFKAREMDFKVAIISQAPDIVLKRFIFVTGFKPDFTSSYFFSFDGEGFLKEIRFKYRDEKGRPSKLLAAKEFALKFSLKPNKVVAIGDHLNDAPMFKWAGYSIAVGPSHWSLREIADLTVDYEDLHKIIHFLQTFDP